MALNIKNTEVERLAAEVARLPGESKTEAITSRQPEMVAARTAGSARPSSHPDSGQSCGDS